MIHPEHLRPPPHDHPADDWNIVEKGCQSRFRVRHGAHWRLGSGAPGHAGALRQAAPMPKREPASAAFVKSVRPCTAKNLVAFVARRPNRSTSGADSALRRGTPTEPPRKAGFRV